MKVRVKLFAGLEKNLDAPDGGREKEMEVPEGASIGQVLDSLGIARDQAKLILVNGRHAAPDAALAAGDLLVVFPPVGGG